MSFPKYLVNFCIFFLRSRLHGKHWDGILPAEFACKPEIRYV